MSEDATGEKAIQGLGALLPAFNLDAGREVFQVDTCRNLVDVLPAMTSGPDESFNDVALFDAQPLKLFIQGPLFFRGYGISLGTHGFSLHAAGWQAAVALYSAASVFSVSATNVSMVLFTFSGVSSITM